MLFEVVLELHVKPGQSAVLKDWLRDNLPQTQAYDGCISVQALEHDRNPDRIVLIGEWESRAQWETYIKWREDRGDFDTLAPMLEDAPRFECYRQIGEWKNAV